MHHFEIDRKLLGFPYNENIEISQKDKIYLSEKIIVRVDRTYQNQKNKIKMIVVSAIIFVLSLMSAQEANAIGHSIGAHGKQPPIEYTIPTLEFEIDPIISNSFTFRQIDSIFSKQMRPFLLFNSQIYITEDF